MEPETSPCMPCTAQGGGMFPASLRAFIDLIREIEPAANDEITDRPVMASALNEPTAC